MHQYLTRLRNLARATGLHRVIARVVGAGTRRKYEAALATYDADRPADVTIEFGPLRPRFHVLGPNHYAGLLVPRESKVIDFFLSRVRPGDVVWDVGANVGFYSVLAAAAAGPTGRVVGFDPHPGCRAELSRNAELNGFGWLTAAPYALGAVRGQLVLHGDSGSTDGLHRLDVDGTGGAGSGLIADVIPGDDWLAEHPGFSPNLLKMDVEGAEPECVAGLASTLAAPTCRTFIAEIHFGILAERKRDAAPAEIISALKAAGFTRTRWLDLSHLAATKD